VVRLTGLRSKVDREAKAEAPSGLAGFGHGLVEPEAWFQGATQELLNEFVGSELVPVGGCGGVRRPEGLERKAMSRPPSRRKTSGRQPRGVILGLLHG